jgi:hypothetical protein
MIENISTLFLLVSKSRMCAQGWGDHKQTCLPPCADQSPWSQKERGQDLQKVPVPTLATTEVLVAVNKV